MFVLKSMALHLPWSHFGSCRRATYAKDTAADGGVTSFLEVANASVH